MTASLALLGFVVLGILLVRRGSVEFHRQSGHAATHRPSMLPAKTVEVGEALTLTGQR